MNSHLPRSACAALCCLLSSFSMWSVGSIANAGPPFLRTLTFDEVTVPFQSVDDLSVGGVTFDFKVAGVDSLDAYYNSYGPGTLDFIQDPSLIGDSAGVLTFDFAYPTSVLQFGVALNTATALTPGFYIELFDEQLNTLGTTAVDVTQLTGDLGFVESTFDYSGTPVTRAVIDFEHDPGRFAIDNLTYASIPEPSATVLVTLALLVVLTSRCPFNVPCRLSRHLVFTKQG